MKIFRACKVTRNIESLKYLQKRIPETGGLKKHWSRLSGYLLFCSVINLAIFFTWSFSLSFAWNMCWGCAMTIWCSTQNWICYKKAWSEVFFSIFILVLQSWKKEWRNCMHEKCPSGGSSQFQIYSNSHSSASKKRILHKYYTNMHYVCTCSHVHTSQVNSQILDSGLSVLICGESFHYHDFLLLPFFFLRSFSIEFSNES